MEQVLEIGSRQVEITNPDKVLFPDEGYTKGDLVEYYHRIADVMLPHLHDRPLTMIRYPNGIKGGIFFRRAHLSACRSGCGVRGWRLKKDPLRWWSVMMPPRWFTWLTWPALLRISG